MTTRGLSGGGVRSYERPIMTTRGRSGGGGL